MCERLKIVVKYQLRAFFNYGKAQMVQGIEQLSAGIQARVRSEQEQMIGDMQGSLKHCPGVELIRGLPSTKSRSMGAIKAEQLEQAR
jgi:hypothetical protein